MLILYDLRLLSTFVHLNSCIEAGQKNDQDKNFLEE